MSDDWDSVTVLRKRPAGQPTRAASAVTHARRTGEVVDTEKKFGAAGNRQHESAKDTAKLDRETEELHHDTISLDVGRAIMTARNNSKLTQKDLGTKINEKPAVIADYESGKAIPNQQILGKLERALGVKLRGKDIGQPLPSRGAK